MPESIIRLSGVGFMLFAGDSLSSVRASRPLPSCSRRLQSDILSPSLVACLHITSISANDCRTYYYYPPTLYCPIQIWSSHVDRSTPAYIHIRTRAC